MASVSTIIAIILAILAVLLILISFIINLVVAARNSTINSDKNALRGSAAMIILGIVFVATAFILLIYNTGETCRKIVIDRFRNLRRPTTVVVGGNQPGYGTDMDI